MIDDSKRQTGRTTDMIYAAVNDAFHERDVIVIMSTVRECERWKRVTRGMPGYERIRWFTPDLVHHAHGLYVDEVHIDHWVMERYAALTEQQRAGIAVLLGTRNRYLGRPFEYAATVVPELHRKARFASMSTLGLLGLWAAILAYTLYHLFVGK